MSEPTFKQVLNVTHVDNADGSGKFVIEFRGKRTAFPWNDYGVLPDQEGAFKLCMKELKFIGEHTKKYGLPIHLGGML